MDKDCDNCRYYKHYAMYPCTRYEVPEPDNGKCYCRPEWKLNLIVINDG